MGPDLGRRVRRVSLRNGTDEDLAKLHQVEVPIETERGSTRMPRKLENYIAFARSLPAQFDDHGWLVEDPESLDPLASAYCWSNSASDSRVMECDILVRADQRRRGIVEDPESLDPFFQQNTGIDPPHRGLGLAKWAKAVMLQRIICDRPHVSRVETGNAFSNGPMLAINEALGFVVTTTRTEWQLNLRG